MMVKLVQDMMEIKSLFILHLLEIMNCQVKITK